MRNFLYVSDLYSTSKLGKQRRGRCVGVCAEPLQVVLSVKLLVV